jgi:LSD1 subclass zinc finger protein
LSATAPSPPGEGRGEGLDAFIKTFPCASCGAKLAFAPGTRELRCDFCGAGNEIGESDARVEELDLAAWLKDLEGRSESEAQELARCDKCGAEQRLDGALFASKCAFCGAGIVSKSYAGRSVRPRSLVPFQVDRQQAHEAFRRWLRRRWLAPGDLKRYAQSDASLMGVYLPFWTYDCETSTAYRGERGTKRDKSTSWTSVSGRVDHFFDDVLVPGSRTLPRSITGALRAWNTKALVPYQPEFIGGFQAEAYQVGLAEAYPAAREEIDRRIREMVLRDIGGDAQRIEQLQTRYGRFTFKHVLLPAWVSAYRYRDRVYRFVVNAQTGETGGESPLSWWKVALLVVAGLVLFYFWLASQ